MMPDINDIIEYESGQMDEDRMIDFFQGMINSGVVWRLQGSYGRTALALVEAGHCLTPDEYAAAETVREEDERETAHENGQFGVGA